MHLYIFLLFTIFISTSNYVEAEIIRNPSLCGRVKCYVSATRKFKYLENIFYRYHYNINITADLGDNLWLSDRTQLYTDADVILNFITPCEGTLQFTNVNLSHERKKHYYEFPDRTSNEFKLSLERYPLRFVYNDGHVHELCPNKKDEIWAVNIKRGFLSALQNTMIRFDIDYRQDELDINGICETFYRLHEARRTSLILRRSKNLMKCRRSTKHHSFLQSKSYQISQYPSFFIKQPVLLSSSDCEITVDHNIYQRVFCVDTHGLQLFSNESRVVKAKVYLTIQLIDEMNNNPVNIADKVDIVDDFTYSKRTNLLYDHTKTYLTIYGELRTSRDLLKSMCNLEVSHMLSQNFSEVFTKFIHSSRLLDYQGLSQLLHRATGICKSGRKHIINALPYIGSNAAVNIMKDLIVENFVDHDKINFWMIAFTLIPKPDHYTIYALSPLLDIQHKIPEAQFLLSYSSVIHTYCTNYKWNCTHFEPIKIFLQYVTKNLDRACLPRVSTQDDVKHTLEALKSIANAGIQTDVLLKKLNDCINDDSGYISNEVKVAAIEAHRRFGSCERIRDEYFLDIYRNNSIDTELRIASYLQVMRCPDYKVVKIIRRTLEEEEVNQVGSFVWSHLKNVLSSSSPTRIEIQSLLTDHNLGNKFNNDMRKFSRNYETSFYSEEYNIGGNYQMNLVFSPKSYIPRTFNFNITVELFGEAINLFELNLRTEGLEYYAENIFGPDGPLSGMKMSKHIHQVLRQFRSASDQFDEHGSDYWRKIRNLPNVIDNNFNNPRISYSYKIFGNEIKFVILNSNNEIQRNILNLNPWEKIKQVLSGKEMIHYENTAMFLDWSYVIPTTSGVPIKLDMTGSAACNIKLSGILNSQKFISDGELDINGNVMPSMNMDLTGSMIVDAFYKSAGIKVKSSLYSVSAAEVEFKLRRLELARLIWKIPKQIMEVFSLTTDVLLITTNGAEYKEISIDNLHHNLLLDPAHSKNVSLKIIKNRTCSWSALDRLIGLKMCIDYQLPNITKDENHSLFLLNGLTVFKLLLIKADSTATSYLLEYKWTRNKNESTLKVAFDTPGSQSPREISATISFIRLNNSVLLLLKSKGNSLIAQGNYRRTDDETFINLALDTNGTKQLEASIGYFIKKTKHGYIYSPKVLLSINNEGIVNLSGIIKNQDKGNLSQCDVDMRFETKHLSSHLYGYVLKGNVSTTGNVKIEYKLNGKIKDDVLHIEFALINRSTITQTYKAADLKLHSTAYPQLNIITGLQYQHVLGHVELFLELNTSPHLYNAERHKLTLQFIATYSKPYFQTDGANVSAYVVIIKPAQNIDIKIGASYYSIASESKTDLLVRYAPEKEITLVINLIIPRRSLFIMEGRVNLTIPKYDSMLIQMNITERRRNKFVLNFTGTWFSGQNISADGIYSDCSTVVIANHDFKITFQSPSFATDIVLNGSFFYDTTDIKIGLSAEQINAGTYALLLNHTSISQSQFYTYLEGKYKHNVYSIISNLDMQSQIIFLIHLDKWRDIYVAAMGINSKLSKEYGMEVKWDANRDPSLKISINGQLNNLKYTDKCKNVSLAISILYPGRLIKGYTLFMASNEAKKYLTDMQLQWSANKKIALTIVTEHEIENNNKLLKFESQIQTPYNDWKKTSINGKYLQTESDVAATTSIYWQNTQHLILELFSKIEMQEVDTMWKFDCGFLSTVHKMHYIRANITHLHVHDKSYNSLITINYFPNKRMEIESVWLIVYKQNQIFNITGNLQFLSPVHNFRKGELKCHFSLMTNWKVYGSAILDLDKRKYTSNLIGDLAKLKESMIHFNVTSPFEKYAHIRSRFGLSESNRHIVAEIVTPTSALGIEGIFQINTDIYNFNIKLLVATSIDIIQKALIVAKLNHKEADFRIAYNNLTAGFEGVWSYNNITDFHYSYILYTPFPGFQEIGIITKLIVLAPSISNIFTIESEFSIRIVELLAGIKINAGPKSTPPSIVIAMKPQLSGIKKYSIRDVYNSTEDLENYFYWKAEIELNAVIIQSITGSIDFEREGYTDKICVFLKIPAGLIIIENILYIEDFFNIQNNLSIDTPFDCASEINSDYSFVVDFVHNVYLMDLSFDIKNYAEWIESGFSCNYTVEEIEERNYQLHILKYDMKTPVYFLKLLSSQTSLEIDDNCYKTNVSIRTANTTTDIYGSLKESIEYIEATVQIKLDSNILSIPETKITVTKKLTNNENMLHFQIDIQKYSLKSGKLHMRWIKHKNFFKGNVILHSWIEKLNDINISLFYNNSLSTENKMHVNVSLMLMKINEYKLNGIIQGSKLEIEVIMPVPNQPQQIKFSGNLIKINNNLYHVIGNISNLEIVDVYLLKIPIIIENTGNILIDIIISKRINNLENETNLEHGKNNEPIFFTKINYTNLFIWNFHTKYLTNFGDIYNLTTFININSEYNAIVFVTIETPLKKFEKLMIDCNYLFNKKIGHFKLNNQVNERLNYILMHWRFFYNLDIFANIAAGYKANGFNEENINVTGFYLKKLKKSFTNFDVGFDININRDKWRFATNSSGQYYDPNNFDGQIEIILPSPTKDIHNLVFSCHIDNNFKHIAYAVGYSTRFTSLNYISDGMMNIDRSDINGHLRLIWGIQKDKIINNVFNATIVNKKIDIKYSLFTPKFIKEDTLVLYINYDVEQEFNTLINISLYYPRRKHIGIATLSYQSLINVNGTLNTSTSLSNFQDIGCEFIILSTSNHYKRYIKASWINNSACFDNEYLYISQHLNSDLKGHIYIEIPLNTKHIGLVNYGYQKKSLTTIGYSEIIYNNNIIIKSRYNAISDSHAGFDKDIINITIENAYKPIGVTYINQYEYSFGKDGTNYPTIEFKEINVFQLNNISAFNISGLCKISKTHIGQTIYLKAVHFNRTIHFQTDYKIFNNEFSQNTRLNLSENAWITYHISILNKTRENIENQLLILNLAYPTRKFTVNTAYELADSKFNSKATLIWSNQTNYQKSIGIALDWISKLTKRNTRCQNTVLTLSHPSFKQDVKFIGNIEPSDYNDLVNLEFRIKYSSNIDQLLVFRIVLRNINNFPANQVYRYTISAKHLKTQLHLNITGFFKIYKNTLIESINNAQYKRSFLPEEKCMILGRIDLSLKEIEFNKTTNELTKYIQTRMYTQYPQYIMNGTMINGKDLTASGNLFIDCQEKLIFMMINYTPDATESLRMFGNIPDARNAEFKLWRTYDQDLIDLDVSFYIRLNHSRLITSKFIWRPELTKDIINIVKESLLNIYEETSKDLDYWGHYVRSETYTIISDIWIDARDDLEEFVSDIKSLLEIQQDFEILKIYLNNSYNANEFYVKDIMTMCLYVIDELSLKNHMQSFPNIINEIWEVMGESGEAIRKSLLWVIESIKQVYRKISDVISSILKGDSMNQIANIVEKLLIKYDVFIKELHVSFIKYVEYLYSKLYQSIALQWHRFLMHVEPIFIHLAYYLENVGWKTIQEFFNFLYDRKVEFITSPYYDQLSNFTQDIDKFYRDIKTNDIITNIKKYSSIIIEFIKERYITVMPFGKELKTVTDEVICEMRELIKLSSIKYAIEKVQQIYNRITYFYEYFKIKAKLETTIRLLHTKLLDISQTALEADNKYREAKTRFVYDPNNGLLIVEQKLPMSWHAFNQTPEFQEIPEYRTMAEMKSYFSFGNTSFWSLYYQIKPMIEPSNWLPPFKAQGIIIGARYYKTFDGRYFDFIGNGTFLVIRDFVDNHFAVLMRHNIKNSNNISTHEIIVLIGNKVIEIDTFKDNVQLMGRNSNLQLPLELNNRTVFIYQVENIVTIEQKNKRFKFECNLKYDICTLELSGWYYGKTAGLLGTMNNEQIDDLLASSGHVEHNISNFLCSWLIEEEYNCSIIENNTKAHSHVENEVSVYIRNFCYDLFMNKTSDFSSCFTIVYPDSYLNMCLNSTNNHEACRIAMAYLQICMFHDTFLRIPNKCTSCVMNETETTVPEGEFRKLEGDEVPISTDITFIVELKECNRIITRSRVLDQLVFHVNKELNINSFLNNRWSLVLFGGTGVYDKPRNLIFDGQIFTKNITRFLQNMNHQLIIGDGNQDIFDAIRFAAQLNFRAGASKTFILMPCSHCEAEKQMLDYSTLFNALLEHVVTLHIITNKEFQFESSRLSRLFYGIDATHSYTKKDLHTINSDSDLNKLINLSKINLGHCAALALETNGSIFSSYKVAANEKLSVIKKFAQVFSKRLVVTAKPNLCQLCECIANNDGHTKMECTPCEYPSPVSINLFSNGFTEDTYAVPDSTDIDYSLIDDGED